MAVGFFLAFANYEIFGHGLFPPCHIILSAKHVYATGLWYIYSDGFVVVGIMYKAVAIYHPIPYPQVERMGAVCGCGVTSDGCLPRGCRHVRQSRSHACPLASGRNMVGIAVLADGGRFVVAPQCR